MKKVYYWVIRRIERILGIYPHEIGRLEIEIKKQQEQLTEIMTALEQLQYAVADLTTVVDQAVTDINTPHPSDAQIQAATDLIEGQVTRLNIALGNIAPTPVDPVVPEV